MCNFVGEKMLNSLVGYLLLALLLIGCSIGTPAAPADMGDDQDIAGSVGKSKPDELVIMSHDSFAISEEVLAEFEKTNNVRIVLLPAGDAGAALNQAILSKQDPLADLFFGLDNTFMSRALAEGIFEEYESPLLAEVPEGLILDQTYHLTPVDYGDVCLNYDRLWFEERAIELPDSLLDLTLPEYKNLLVVENPATSSPGLAFLLATIVEFGTDGNYTYLDYWAALRENGVMVVDGWEAAYYGYFSAVSDGSRPLVVSYASSPTAEIVFANPPIDEPPSGSITEPGTCFRQVEFVGISKGTSQRQNAEKFIDFMIGKVFQEDIPLNMFVFPVNQNAILPKVFIDWASVPEELGTIDPDIIDAKREEWIQSWTEVVLR